MQNITALAWNIEKYFLNQKDFLNKVELNMGCATQFGEGHRADEKI